MIFPIISKELTLIKRNIQSRQGRFQADKQHYFVMHDILPEKDFQHIGVNAGCKFGWQAQDLNQYGACGNAKLADAKKGEVTLEFATKRVLKVIEEIESLPSSLISDKTAY